jgi:hypothetical protein
LPKIKYDKDITQFTYTATMKLSRSGWNNVIIFSIMAFILMINVTNRKLFTDDELITSEQSLLLIEEGSVILTVMVNQQMSVERDGLSWRTVPQGLLTAQAAEQMMRAWHNASGELLAVDFDRNEHQAIMVSMMLAGERTIHLFSFYPFAEQLIVFNHQSAQYLALPPQLYKQLLPDETLVGTL